MPISYLYSALPEQRNRFQRWRRIRLMVEFDPVLVALLAMLLGFVFFVYLFIRRIVTAFKSGQEQGRR